MRRRARRRSPSTWSSRPGSATRSRPLRLTSIASTDPERFLITGTGAPDATGGGVDAARCAARRLALAALAFVVALAWAQDARAFCQAASCVPDGVGHVCTPSQPDEVADCVLPLAWKSRC